MCDLLYSAGLVCLNDTNDITYTAAQSESCTDLAFVTSSHSHPFEARVEASLEKNHQHLVVGWDKSIFRLGAHAPAVRHVDCRRISDTFDSDKFSCALTDCTLRRSSWCRLRSDFWADQTIRNRS